MDMWRSAHFYPIRREESTTQIFDFGAFFFEFAVLQVEKKSVCVVIITANGMMMHATHLSCKRLTCPTAVCMVHRTEYRAHLSCIDEDTKQIAGWKTA